MAVDILSKAKSWTFTYKEAFLKKNYSTNAIFLKCTKSIFYLILNYQPDILYGVSNS